MTRSRTTAVLALIGGVALGGAAALAQTDGMPSNAMSSTAMAKRPAVKGVGSASLSTQSSSANGDSGEMIPIAQTVDNSANNPPVSGTTGSSATK
jgi:hypothetical protein